MKTQTFPYIIIGLVIALSACQKGFLEQKPDQALLVPETLTDFQSLLDNSNSVMNYSPYLSTISSDDIYTPSNGLAGQSVEIQNSYVWAPVIFQSTSGIDWTRPYQQVFYANIVLDGLKDFKGAASITQLNELRGAAYFYRAFAFYNIAQEFAPPYNPASAQADPGIPLRLSSDVNDKTVRSTLRQTYEQIIADLNQAHNLLPANTAFKTRPTKTAADALLARVYQTMQDYDQALTYANQSLQGGPKLLDYNSLAPSAAFPMPVALRNGTDEVIFYAVLINNGMLNGTASLTGIDTALYKTYSGNDLRKKLFFNDSGNHIYRFRGSYTGTSLPFSGLATDEQYLIRAECYARTGHPEAAMADLNALLQMRYQTGSFIPLTASGASDALGQVLLERRKELVYRDLRWTDLRRLNQDPQFAKTLVRTVKDQNYTLAPNDNKYVFPIPDEVISTSGIQQNPR
ncbi:RagB/SusD family nutrient uptake outer membrane protein [Mucilaginibacter kameinonensis]|uniref:RagB/SusD family nutrient uptake outer membrane protein n=1 Tax=Mucilaginibacter kameinonensis TaxID=452286 RepID=UPI000EF7D3E6|nr:RagB/SusD family nutrient uptake outer membrane protein [Mucilaginibacter kameinonensis]